MSQRPAKSLIPRERIEGAILFMRGYKVMLDRDLARLYGVTVGALNQAIKRNAERFPSDFMFQLESVELENLKSQTVISSWGGSRHRPRAFTENGVAMLSSVLRSKKAIAVNIEVMRAFSRLRRLLASHEDLARKLEDLESRYDAQFKVVFEAIRDLMPLSEEPKKERIGFVPRRNPEANKGRRKAVLN